MSTTTMLRILVYLCAFVAVNLGAQSVGGGYGPVINIGAPLGQSQGAPNIFFFGVATSINYDTNAANVQNPTPNSQFTLYPQFGLSISRPRWSSLVNYIPGVSYSTSSVPSYNAVSQVFGAAFQYRATKRLTLSVLNSYLSSTNPFDSLRAGTVLPQFGLLSTPTPVAWDYLPRTNEQAAVDAVYNLSARTKLQAGGAYNYISYQGSGGHNTPGSIFQQSNSEEFTFGLFHASRAHYSSGIQYTAQQLDAGHGEVRTGAQSVGYVLEYSPRPSLHLSAMVGPQYLDTTFSPTPAGGAIATLLNGHAAGWSWMGGGTVSWTGRRSEVSASLIRQLNTGNQYQGPIRQTLANLQIQQQLSKQTSVSSFIGYNINEPPFTTLSLAQLSKYYLSAGTGISRKLGDKWTMSLTYMYLRQNQPSSLAHTYNSGNHSLVQFSLSYLIAKPIRR